MKSGGSHFQNTHWQHRVAAEGYKWQHIRTRDRGGLREPVARISPMVPGEENGRELGIIRQPVSGGREWPQQRIRSPHTRARGNQLSAAAGEDAKTPGSNCSVLYYPWPEHKGCATYSADQWGQGPTGKIYTRQDTARKDWRVTQGPDTYSLAAGW